MSRRRSIFVINQENQYQIKLQEEQLSIKIDENIRCLAFHHPIKDNLKCHFEKVKINLQFN